MAQVLDANTVLTPISKERKTYSVNIKGLIVHLLDILFTDRAEPRTHYAAELSGHMQKDIGLYR
ncbi:hypothetical protein [Vibrio panuliri]|uniref:Uncharacterized protein n=1 Tax=Vibrio panuliri TaxID=1381081 RepID=A0A1Q9H9U0_9VIBR|nr:hypothetical protein [Vibrio panuliri]KAB1457376.1 hypothetical protein F7O85_06440 [Vibrio panuliri]OLQ85842.1 hypothetical protein BIY22_13225 [Vibrio panuliri]OLQ91463.1 hypothetical protein BIY20_01240 [Vibrio panuliri]